METQYEAPIWIDAIVPAYNEEATIRNVVEVLCQSPWVRHVWVVSDGSTDGTVGEVQDSGSGAQVIDLAENKGKAAAMMAGVEASAAPYMLFMDADLMGLTEAHVEAMAQPILAGACQSTLGLFRKGRLHTDLAQKTMPFLSGQRVVPRWLMMELQRRYDLEELRYGIETAITHMLHWHRIRAERVALDHMTQRTKEEKNGGRAGVARRLRMYGQIVAALLMTVAVRHIIMTLRK